MKENWSLCLEGPYWGDMSAQSLGYVVEKSTKREHIS